MLIKDMRRAERRARSYYTWLRRVKNDWNTHGWNWNPRPYYHMKSGLTKQGACSIWSETDLCECFYDPGMAGWARFKDTPHRVCSPYECDPRRASKGAEAKPIQELRAEEAQEDWHIRKPNPDQVTSVRQRCLCGFLFGFIRVKVKDRRRWSMRNRDNRRCDDCKRRFGHSQELWPQEKLKRPA